MTRPRHLHGALIVALLATSGACSFIIDTDAKQCEVNADCAALDSPESECVNSLCIDRVFGCRNTPFTEPSGETVEFSLNAYNLLGFTPYEGLTVQECPYLDTDCGSPAEEAITDETGRFTLSLEVGFRGHLFVPTPADNLSLVPLKAHVFPPPSDDTTVPVRGPLVVATSEVVNNLATQVGSSVEPNTGQIFFTAIDCTGAPLAGVTVSPQTTMLGTEVAYLGASGQPDLTLTGTDSSGQGAIVNVPPGFVTIRGTHETKGLIFEQAVIVAPNTITSVPIVPSPT